MTLLGHSLGGYLGTVYALKYPDRVDRLILASPGTVIRHSFSIIFNNQYHITKY
jgi:pimeloyl-ACP methyl ester carboxylesterase